MISIRELRLNKGMTQDELADVTGIKQATISDIERGKIKNPSVDTAIRLAKALTVSIEEIFPVNKPAA